MTMHFKTLQNSIANFMPIHLTKGIKEMKYLALSHHSIEIVHNLFSSNEDSFWRRINLTTLRPANILHRFCIALSGPLPPVIVRPLLGSVCLNA